MKYPLDEKQQTEQTDFRDWLTMKINWHNSDISMSNLDATNLDLLKSFADSRNSLAGLKAKNVVNFFYAGTYRNYPEVPNEDGMRKAATKAKVAKTLDTKNYVKVYPNPSNSYVAFEYKVLCANAAHIEVFNATGISVLNEEVAGTQSVKIINASQFVDGTYFYKLICDNNVIGQGNFVIQK